MRVCPSGRPVYCPGGFGDQEYEKKDQPAGGAIAQPIDSCSLNAPRERLAPPQRRHRVRHDLWPLTQRISAPFRFGMAFFRQSNGSTRHASLRLSRSGASRLLFARNRRTGPAQPSEVHQIDRSGGPSAGYGRALYL